MTNLEKAKENLKQTELLINGYRGDFDNLCKICKGRKVDDIMFDFDWRNITITVTKHGYNRAKIVGCVDVYDNENYVGTYTKEELLLM